MKKSNCDNSLTPRADREVSETMKKRDCLRNLVLSASACDHLKCCYRIYVAMQRLSQSGTDPEKQKILKKLEARFQQELINFYCNLTGDKLIGLRYNLIVSVSALDHLECCHQSCENLQRFSPSGTDPEKQKILKKLEARFQEDLIDFFDDFVRSKLIGTLLR